MTITQKEFYELCSSPSGILLENSFVRVGVRQEYKGPQGRLSVYIGNVCAQETLKNFQVIFLSSQVDHIRVQIEEATQGLLLPNGCNIAPGTQAKLLLKVTVLAPFTHVPTMRLLFYSNNGTNHHEHHISLPCIATCFLEKTTSPLGMEQYKSQWKAFQENECRDILKQVPAVNQSYMKQLARILTERLNFGRCLECDDTPWSVTGAATFPTAAKDSKTGKPVNLACLVRIEADHKHRAVRVSTRAQQLQCSKAIHGIVLGNIKNM